MKNRYDTKERPRIIESARVKQLIDPLTFYLQEGLEIDHRGRSAWKIAGVCPFHEDSSPGSFKINITTGAFRCWSCGEYGSDIISFIQKRDKLGFLDTLRKLCHDWRLT
jgi:DNA primase